MVTGLRQLSARGRWVNDIQPAEAGVIPSAIEPDVKLLIYSLLSYRLR